MTSKLTALSTPQWSATSRVLSPCLTNLKGRQVTRDLRGYLAPNWRACASGAIPSGRGADERRRTSCPRNAQVLRASWRPTAWLGGQAHGSIIVRLNRQSKKIR